jgi:hypothetical protein
MEDRELSTEEYYRVVRPTKTAGIIGYSTVHLRRLEEAGIFPKRFKLNPNGGKYGACGHYFGWIVDYLKARAAARIASEKPEVA